MNAVPLFLGVVLILSIIALIRGTYFAVSQKISARLRFYRVCFVWSIILCALTFVYFLAGWLPYDFSEISSCNNVYTSNLDCEYLQTEQLLVNTRWSSGILCVFAALVALIASKLSQYTEGRGKIGNDAR
jgi:hypothetical protein